MSITFNAFEVFEMAEQIERNGVRFYQKAAKIMSDHHMRKLMLDLADMEAQHEQVFTNMRKELSDESREQMIFDPENEISLYLQAMANGHVFDLENDSSELLTETSTLEDIIKMALTAEKDSIVFYLGLKDFVTVKAGKEKIDNIIKEEMGHIVLLNRKLTDLYP